MKVVAHTGDPDLAMVYIGEDESGRRLEFVESLEPPYLREEKWVNILSTLWGCPIQCRFCDAGLKYKGRVNAATMLAQLDALVSMRYPDRVIPSRKWKIQFARMGEPAFNRDVITVLRELPNRYVAPGLMPSVSTVAPKGCNRFFNELLDVKHELYPHRFQFQFSLHSTDPEERRRLIPAPTMTFAEMAEYGDRIYRGEGRKVTLNFALGVGLQVNAEEAMRWFNPDSFLIKLTPMNPTVQATRNGYIDDSPDPSRFVADKADQFRDVGFEVIESIGELEENAIGSNCGQYLERMNKCSIPVSYSYPQVSLP
ncbi:radical SAM protein [bacterium]|nr:radical SAM protein [bacterium]